MRARRRAWWHSLREYWIVAIVIVFLAVGIVIFLGYWLKWDWTGFPAKTLWDWLNLFGVLAIPAVVGLGAAWYTAQQGKISDRENVDNQRETALQGYIDKMSELLLHEKLRDSAEEDGIRNIARVRTLTVLRRLDAHRKATVLQFLYESHLIDKGKRILDLSSADFSEADLSDAKLILANLSDANLSGATLALANLSGATLEHASLHGADLSGADLSDATLVDANLSDANLIWANLSGANLSGAFRGTNLSGADLSTADPLDVRIITSKELEEQATSLKGATMPDGSIHP